MNEELQNAVTSMLETAVSGLGSATDFLTDEIPLYVQELLMWKALYSGVMCLTGVIILSITIYFCIRFFQWGMKTKRLKRRSYESERDYSNFYLNGERTVVAAFAALCAGLASLLFINLTWLQIWIAPRVYLIEYAARLAQ